jgi:hypothetical protein
VTPAERTLQRVNAATVEQTLACETGNCHRCRGTVYSLTSTHGRPCAHACHGADDLAEAALERDHYHGDLFASATGRSEADGAV